MTPRAAQRSRRLDHVELVAQVEARGRLVEQQHARSVRGLAAGELNQHAREMRALLLAARQRGDDAVAEAAEIDLGERRVDQRVDRAGRADRRRPCARSRRP